MNEVQNPQSNIGGEEISLWDIVNILLRRCYWLLLAGIVFGAAVYFAVTFFVAPTYESKVSFYVYNGSNSVSQSGTINNSDLQAAESLATTYSKILASNSVLDAVLEDLGADTSLSRKDLSEMVGVSVISNTQLLEVVVTTANPDFSCKIAESFANVAPTQIVRITKAGGVEVVDQPEVATEKSSPKTIFDSILGFLIGVFIAAVILITRMLSDTTVYLPEDVSKLTGVTVLGQIPNINVKDVERSEWTLTEGGARHDSQEKQPRSSK